jgi:shikimate dehydrogenase
MVPDTTGSPWPADRRFPDGCAVYDLVYNLPETAFLRLARAQGAPAAGGLGMLVEQAALAFEIWTGVLPPVEALRETAGAELMAIRKEQG